MSEKEDARFSKAQSLASTIFKESEQKNDFNERLAKLPEQYRDEILKQYDLPEPSATLLSVFKYATWIEIFLMVVGTFTAIASGRKPLLKF